MTRETQSSPKPAAPPKAKIVPVINEYHGHKVSDPYQWLENSAGEETRQFVAEENAYTRSVLEGLPGRNEMRGRIERLLTIGRMSAPRIGGTQYFYERRDGHQNQSVVYVREGSGGKDRALIDVDALAEDGTVALDWWFPSDDGKYVAFGTSANGSELSTLQIIDVGSGALQAEKIERTRAASLAWLPDSSGFYYTRYPRPGEVPAGEEVYNRRIFFHQIDHGKNADGKADPQVFPVEGADVSPQDWPGVSLSEDGRWLLVEINKGWTRTELYLKDLSAPANQFQKITTGKDFIYRGEIFKGQIYITTNEGASKFRVFKSACAAPARENWKEIIAEADSVIEGQAALIRTKNF